MMPEMDGYEVCEKLKKDPMTKNIPVIILTAKDAVREKVKGLDIGADDYVTKPFNLKELKARIKSALRRAKN
jgi:two-component system alkaline phosphatase synthesis response regulator PhoP